MRRSSSATAFGALFALLATRAVQAAPPPPPPAHIDTLARQLLETPTPDTFSSYTQLFADDLEVVRNGQPVSRGKEAWVSSQRRLLGKVDRRVVMYAEGDQDVMIVDQYDDLSDTVDRPGMIFDSRFKTRVTHYEVGADHLVHRIRSEEGDGSWRVAAKVNLAPGTFTTGR